MAKKKKTKSRGRARRAGKGIIGSAGRGVLSAAVGAGSYHLQRIASENSEYVRDNWWAGPAVTFGLATVVGMSRKPVMRQAAASLATAAGYSGAMAYALTEAGHDAGAVFEPAQRVHQLPQQAVMPMEAVIEDEPPAQEAAAVYPPRGPMNAFTPVNYGRVA